MAEKKAILSNRYFPTNIPIAKIPIAGAQFSVGDEVKGWHVRRQKEELDKANLAEIARTRATDELEVARLEKEAREIKNNGGYKPAAGSNNNSDDDKIFQVDFDNMRPRPAKEGERGMTLVQAKEIINDYRTSQDQPAVVIFDQQVGHYIPNPASIWAKTNNEAAWALAKDYDRKLMAGDPPDPVEAAVSQIKKADELKKTLGIDDSKKPDSLRDTLQTLKEFNLLPDPSKQVEKPAENEEVKKYREMVQGLSQTVTKLLEEQQKSKDKAMLDSINDLNKKFEDYRADRGKDQQTNNEWSLTGKALDKGGEVLQGFGKTVDSVATRLLDIAEGKKNSKTDEATALKNKDRITQAALKEAEEAKVLKPLENVILNVKPPAAPPLKPEGGT